MYMVFMGLAGLFGLVAAVFGIILLINAFKTDTTQGILCLCVPFYALYWAFAKFTHPKKGLIIAGWLGAAVLAGIMNVLSGIFAASAFNDAAQQQMQMMQQMQQPGAVPAWPAPPQ
ncbi:MAG: hypothetical protein HYY06_29025 [Deltaproteobacteria bacterium]|nr:hypothetical protein [Deltaproteobacteria bacterium]